MLISIAMATYNGAQYISEQIDSILSQSYTKFELIIVDDCSTDKTIDIIKGFKDPRIKIIQSTYNSGCSKSFEKAIEHCNGDYIALCDQDDIWYINKLDTMIKNIGQFSMVYSDFDCINRIGKKIRTNSSYINKLQGIDSSNKNIIPLCFFNSFVLGCSCMFKSELKDIILPIRDEGYNHDKWIVFAAANHKGIKFIDEKIFAYRLHENNLSMTSKKTGIKNLSLNSFSSKSRKQYYQYSTLKELSLKVNKNIDMQNLLRISSKNKIYMKLGLILNYYPFIAARYSKLTRAKQIFKILIN